jgi:hypothetical protein
MANSNNRGGNRGGNRGRNNNNPEGRNQYSGLTARALDNPVATAAAVGGAVAAGVFLWSRRNQISDQISNLSDQISEWRDGWQSGDDFAASDDTTTESFIASPRRRSGSTGRKSQSDIAEEALTLKETGKATT